jgi:hypothetical protein
MEQVFTYIYENKIWGNNYNAKYNGSSGEGSSINYNKDSYVIFLKKFITDNQIKKVIDLGCGDFICGPYIYSDLDVTYRGYDVYKNVIEFNSSQYPKSKFKFVHLDFYNEKEEIQGGDLCILKDVLQHWPLKDIYEFLDYLVESKKFKYILICNCCYQDTDDTDIQIGNFRCLSSDFLPLKKYNAQKVYNYNTKEVSVITTVTE